MPTTDAYTTRVTALFNALNVLGPPLVTGLLDGAQDLSDQRVLSALERATSNLIGQTTTVLGVDVAGDPMDTHTAARDLVALTMTATRWTQQLVHMLGGIYDTDLLVNAVTAAAIYQLALRLRCRSHQDLLAVATAVLAIANSPA